MLVLPLYDSRSIIWSSYVPCTPIQNSDGLPDSVLPRLLARRLDWTIRYNNHHLLYLFKSKSSDIRKWLLTLSYWFTLSCIDQYSPLLHIIYALDFFISSVGNQAFTLPTRHWLGKLLSYQLPAERQVNRLKNGINSPVTDQFAISDLHVLKYLDTHPVVSWLNTYYYVLSLSKNFTSYWDRKSVV